MKEEVDFNTIIKDYHDRTRESIRKQFKGKEIYIDDRNIIIKIFDKIDKKGKLFNHKEMRLIGTFRIAFTRGYLNVIVVEKDGKYYYDIFRKIGEEVGYDTIRHKWMD